MDAGERGEHAYPSPWFPGIGAVIASLEYRTPSPVLGCSWWLLASRQLSPPDPQPSLPESHNLGPVSSDLTGRLLGPRGSVKVSC